MFQGYAIKQKQVNISLILGVISILVYFSPLLAFPFSLAGLGLGIVGFKNNQRYSKTAVTISSLGFFFVLLTALGGCPLFDFLTAGV